MANVSIEINGHKYNMGCEDGQEEHLIRLGRYFDNHVVEQHLAVIYDKVNIIKTSFKNHGPTVIADAAAASVFIPPRLKRLLAQQPR